MTPSVENFLNRQPTTGIYHGLVYVLLACNFFPIAFNHWVMIFYGHEPPHNCKMPEGWAWHRNDSIPIVFNNGQGQFHKCHMYKDPENHAQGNKRCVYGWQYELTSPEWPIVAEWNLVCDRSHLVHVVTVLYFVGCLLGALIFGTLADRFGRRSIMFICLFGQAIVGITMFFIRRFILFATLRFVQGIFIQGLEISTFVMVMEIFRPKFRTMAGSGCFIFYTCGMMFLSFLGYTIQHWRYIQLAISVPSIIGVFYLCLVPESLRWLIVNLRTIEVTTVLKKCSRISSTPLDSNVNDSVERIVKQLELDARLFYDVRDLFRSATLRRFSLFHCFCWLSASLVYISLAHFVSDLNENKYLNFLLISIIELLSHIASLLALQRFGRRKPLFLFFIVGGVLSICSVLVEHLAKNQSENAGKVSIVLAGLGKICISACMSGLYIFTTEVFPTVFRSIGVGLCSVWKITGILLVPVINLLGPHTLKAIPIILVGAVSMVAAFVVLMLPETLNKPLPDTPEEAEDLGQQKLVTPIISKPSTQFGKYDIDPPKTPPLKRSTTVTNEKETSSNVQPEQESDTKDTPDASTISPNSHRSSRIVRFLGIDVLDDWAHQRTRKKSVNSNDPVLAQERRVRFSNVVHDIDGLMAAIQAAAMAKNDDTPQTDDLDKHVDTDKTSSTDQQQSHCSVSAEDSPELTINDTQAVEPEVTDLVRPVVGILKKTSQDETCKKIVKSPHPVRKLLPNKTDSPEIVQDVNVNIETIQTMDTEEIRDQENEASEEHETNNESIECLNNTMDLSPDLLRLNCLSPPPDDGTRTPSSSSSGEPTPEGLRKSIQSDDVEATEKEETSSEDGEMLNRQDSAKDNYHINETHNCSLAVYVDCNANEVSQRKRKLSVFEMPPEPTFYPQSPQICS